MSKFFKTLFIALLCFTGIVLAASDSLGVAGDGITKLFQKIGLSEALVGGLVTVLGAAAFRVIQIVLQRLPTKWKWVNNRLTLGIINRVLSWAFGKTTMLYNAQLVNDQKEELKAKEELKKTALKHLSRNGGILLQAFNDAVKKE